MTTTPTHDEKKDQALKLALAHMLQPVTEHGDKFIWFVPGAKRHLEEIQEEEWLHVCWLVEQELTEHEQDRYVNEIFTDSPHNENLGPALNDGPDLMIPSQFTLIHASWQQRAVALCKVKGVSCE